MKTNIHTHSYRRMDCANLDADIETYHDCLQGLTLT